MILGKFSTNYMQFYKHIFGDGQEKSVEFKDN